MRDLIGKYNRNRKLIWFILGCCVVVYIIIHILNSFFGQKLYDNANSINITKDNTFYDTNYSVISSEKIDEEYEEDIRQTIKNFINNCNENKIEEAYSILSEDCKNVLYPTIDDFRERYYRQMFSERKTYNIQAWIVNKNKYTYRIELMDDILLNGTTSNEKKVDYFTITKVDDKYYLNISNFIETNKIDKVNENDSVKITVKSEDVFMEYVYVNIEVENETNNYMLLDEGKKGNSVYLKDSKDIAHSSYLFEETMENLILNKRSKKDFKIKFEKEYKTNIKIKEIGFTDIVINYNEEDEKTISKVVITINNNEN